MSAQNKRGKITDANASVYCRILRSPFSREFSSELKFGKSVRAGTRLAIGKPPRSMHLVQNRAVEAQDY